MALQKPTYTQIPNDFLDNYMSIISKEAVLVFLAICRKTIGWRKDTDKISQSQLLQMTSIKSVNGLKKAIKELVTKEMIIIERSGIGKNIRTAYEINFVSSDNISQPDIIKSVNISSHDTKSLFNISCHDTTKENNINKNNINKEYKETAILVLNYLNEKTGHKYKPTKGTLSFINSRLKEKFTVDDCKKVIDVKCAEWKGTEFEKYLTYTTLFRPNHFQKYLNQKQISNNTNKYRESAGRIIKHLNSRLFFDKSNFSNYTMSDFPTYDYNCDDILKYPEAMLRIGKTETDCMRVIDVMVSYWKFNPSMREFLRPSTLFNTEKFDRYLSKPKKPKWETLDDGATWQWEEE